MFEGKKIWAIIPARKGSKRIPGKNLRLLAGKPLIKWTFEATKKSKYIDRIFVSTDCEEIQSYSKKNNIEAPFLRPRELAQDNSRTVDSLIHFFNQFCEKDLPDLLIVLQPTSPLRKTEHIDQAIEFFFYKNANSVVSLAKAPSSIFWANKISEDLNLENFFNQEYLLKRSQELPDYFTLNGAIYICDLKTFQEEKEIVFKKRVYGFIMDKESSIDIDEDIDFKFAEFLISSNLEKTGTAKYHP